MDLQKVKSSPLFSILRSLLGGIKVKFYPDRGQVVFSKGEDVQAVSFEEIERLVNDE